MVKEPMTDGNVVTINVEVSSEVIQRPDAAPAGKN